jgi:hypothetical protein
VAALDLMAAAYSTNVIVPSYPAPGSGQLTSAQVDTAKAILIELRVISNLLNLGTNYNIDVMRADELFSVTPPGNPQS